MQSTSFQSRSLVQHVWFSVALVAALAACDKDPPPAPALAPSAPEAAEDPKRHGPRPKPASGKDPAQLVFEVGPRRGRDYYATVRSDGTGFRKLGARDWLPSVGEREHIGQLSFTPDLKSIVFQHQVPYDNWTIYRDTISMVNLDKTGLRTFLPMDPKQRGKRAQAVHVTLGQDGKTGWVATMGGTIAVDIATGKVTRFPPTAGKVLGVVNGVGYARKSERDEKHKTIDWHVLRMDARTGKHTLLKNVTKTGTFDRMEAHVFERDSASSDGKTILSGVNRGPVMKLTFFDGDLKQSDAVEVDSDWNDDDPDERLYGLLSPLIGPRGRWVYFYEKRDGLLRFPVTAIAGRKRMHMRELMPSCEQVLAKNRSPAANVDMRSASLLPLHVYPVPN